VVVVYKIDRLTRSLFDFAKIVEAFDAGGVSFVSITQQFNTTTSMGRLTLNVLLSFAQFEREVAGERIRDKIAASKKKGMWMGGLPSLGYDVQNRKLVVNDEEALTVLHIFRRYIQLRSVRALQAELDAAGIRSKRRTLADGTPYGGQKLSRGALYLMLQNRIYRGEITHQGNAYPGEHPAIVDKPLWDQVRSILAENRVNRATGSDAKHPSLLVGLAFDENGERLTPSHAVKKGTRYRYYVSTSLITGTAKDRSKGRRIPAANLESLVITRLRTFFSDQGAILDAIRDEHADGAVQSRLIARGLNIAEELETLAPDQIRAMLMNLHSRVDIRPDCVEINIRRDRLFDLLGAQLIDPSTQGGKSDSESESEYLLALTVRARLQRVGREMRMLVENTDDRTAADPGLLRIVARAHEIQERLMQNTDLTVHVIASQERVSANYVYRLLRLPTLAPDIITAIVNGKNPPQLTAKKLMQLTPQIPVDWAEQRKLLGFQPR
jgi:site-specific DNA recombinase